MNNLFIFSNATAKRDIKELINDKIIKRLGGRPKTYYMLNR